MTSGSSTRLTSVRNWFVELGVSRSLAIYALLALSIGALVVVAPSRLSTSPTRQLLTTLALIQATIFAIVFSVTTFAVQSVSTRYSAQLTTLFLRDPLFKSTFFVFVFAIALDIVAFLVLDILPPVYRQLMFGGALGFGLATVVAFYLFITQTILRNVPSQLIDDIIQYQLQPAHFVPDTSTAWQENSLGPVHPLTKLLGILSSALNDRDYDTVRIGLEELEETSRATIEYVCETWQEDEDEFLETFFAYPFEKSVPDLLLTVFNQGQYELITPILDVSKETGRTGLDYEIDGPAKRVGQGLIDTFDEAPITQDGTRLRDPLLEAHDELVQEAVAKQRFQVFSHLYPGMNRRIESFLRREPDTHTAEGTLRRYWGSHMPDVFECLIEETADEIVEEDSDWLHPHGDEGPLSDQAKILRTFWRLRTSMAETILNYYRHTGTFPIAEGNLRDGWKRLIQTAVDWNLLGLATLFAISMIRMAYVHEMLTGKGSGLWINDLALVKRDVSETVVDRALRHLKQESGPGLGIPVGSYRTQQHGETGGRSTSIFARFLENEEQVRFSDWVAQFEKEVEQRVRTLNSD